MKLTDEITKPFVEVIGFIGLIISSLIILIFTIFFSILKRKKNENT